MARVKLDFVIVHRCFASGRGLRERSIVVRSMTLRERLIRLNLRKRGAGSYR
jgi:hypothetical protein